jgi:phage shock protein A
VDAAVVWGFGTLALLTLLGVVLIWQGFATWRTRVIATNDKGYRALAEQAVASQQATEQHLRDLSAQVAELAARMAALEHVLKEIE